MLTIQGRAIGQEKAPYFIAEMSGNHNGDLERALEIVRVVADAGADAIKLQTYTPDTITINAKGGLFDITDKNSLWYGKNLYALYGEAYTPWDWHGPIFEEAAKCGIAAFSSPFDETAVDFLMSLHVPAFKIASFENNHIPLLKKVAATGKPVLVSTGVSTQDDVELAVQTLKDVGCKEFALFKCTSTYPADPDDCNLMTIPWMREKYQCEVGLSDHTLGIHIPLASIALGATIIEKHITLRRSDGGVDSAFSMEPHELKQLVEQGREVWNSRGGIQTGVTEREKKSIQFKRSIYCVKDIQKGEIFTSENIRVIRPGDGMHPKYYEDLLGQKAKRGYKYGEAIRF